MQHNHINYDYYKFDNKNLDKNNLINLLNVSRVKLKPSSSLSCHAAIRDFPDSLSLSLSLSLSRYLSLSLLASVRSSRLHPVSVESCSRLVVVGRPTLARSGEGIHGRTSLMSSSLLLQKCLACLVRLIWV